MSTLYWNLAGGDLEQDWSDRSLITANNDWSRVSGIRGFRGDGLAARTGIDPQSITGSSDVVNVLANQTNPNTLSTGGVAEFHIDDPVVALQGSGTAAAPYLAFFLDATGRRGVEVSFNLRDIDGSGDNAVQQVAVQYRIAEDGPWVNLPEGYIADATTGPNQASLVTPVRVRLPADADNAATLQVRVITTNAVGNDEWVGIDDIVVTSSPSSGDAPGTLSIGDASVAEGDAGVGFISFTVTRVGGADGAVEAAYRVDLPGGERGASADDFATFATTGTVRFEDGQTRAVIRLPVLGDTVPEFDEQFTVTLTGVSGGAALDRVVATGTILNDDVLPLSIGQIQGAGHRSPVEGQQVTTAGIVTAVDSNGFYLQDMGDGDARTSDAIFVFTGRAPDVFVGDGLSIRGLVSEFQGTRGGLTVTQIVNADIVVESFGNVLPDVVRIGEGGLLPPSRTIDDDGLTTFDPATDGIDFWESLEGMRVTIDRPRVVSNTTADRFAETDVVASLGNGATGLNARGGITISEGDFNPEKIQIQGRATVFDGFAPDYRIGDVLSDVTGIVNYAAGVFEVIVTEAVAVTERTPVGRERTALTGDAGSLSIATYNVENLDPTDNKFDLLARDIVFNLRAPDLVALQEIQDADGAGRGTDLSGTVTAQKLIDAIAATGGGRYAYVEVAPERANTTGGEPNGNIRNGFLYNVDRVDYVEGSATLIAGSAYTNSRNPLVARFAFNGEEITAINVHFTSRGGSDLLWGATQPPADAGDASRTAQAAGVKAYVAGLLAADPSLNVAVMGDFNGFKWEAAQTQLTDPGQGGVFTNLATLLPEAERYSYMFQGNAQQLDHILVTGGLANGARYDAVHINAEFGGTRPTDHDPQLTVVRLGRGDMQGAPTLDALLGGGESLPASPLRWVEDDAVAQLVAEQPVDWSWQPVEPMMQVQLLHA